MSKHRDSFNDENFSIEPKLKSKLDLIARLKQGKTRGVIPYGYTKDENDVIIIEEKEAEVVKEIFKLILDGESTQAVADKLNNEYVQPRATKSKGEDVKWSASAIKVIINNTFYKGERLFDGNIYSVATYFDAEYFARVNLKLNEKKIHKTAKPVNEFLLKGLVTCGVCEKPYYGIKRPSKGDNHYVCSSTRVKGKTCGNKRINIDRLDNAIWKRLLISQKLNLSKNDNNLILNLNTLIKKAEKKISKIKVEQNELKSKKEKLLEILSMGKISEYDVSEILLNLREESMRLTIEIKSLVNDVAKFKNQLTTMDRYKDSNQNLEKFISLNNFQDKIKIVNDFIENIVVKYDCEIKDFKVEFEYAFPVDKFIYAMNSIPDDKLDDIIERNGLNVNESNRRAGLYLGNEFIYDDKLNVYTIDESKKELFVPIYSKAQLQEINKMKLGK